MTPTTHSGSKVRRSILQGIPENKEIEVISTPKTPKKTPKVINKYSKHMNLYKYKYFFQVLVYL